MISTELLLPKIVFLEMNTNHIRMQTKLVPKQAKSLTKAHERISDIGKWINKMADSRGYQFQNQIISLSNELVLLALCQKYVRTSDTFPAVKSIVSDSK